MMGDMGNSRGRVPGFGGVIMILFCSETNQEEFEQQRRDPGG